MALREFFARHLWWLHSSTIIVTFIAANAFLLLALRVPVPAMPWHPYVSLTSIQFEVPPPNHSKSGHVKYPSVRGYGRWEIDDITVEYNGSYAWAWHACLQAFLDGNESQWDPKGREPWLMHTYWTEPLRAGWLRCTAQLKEKLNSVPEEELRARLSAELNSVRQAGAVSAAKRSARRAVYSFSCICLFMAFVFLLFSLLSKAPSESISADSNKTGHSVSVRSVFQDVRRFQVNTLFLFMLVLSSAVFLWLNAQATYHAYGDRYGGEQGWPLRHLDYYQDGFGSSWNTLLATERSAAVTHPTRLFFNIVFCAFAAVVVAGVSARLWRSWSGARKCIFCLFMLFWIGSNFIPYQWHHRLIGLRGIAQGFPMRIATYDEPSAIANSVLPWPLDSNLELVYLYERAVGFNAFLGIVCGSLFAQFSVELFLASRKRYDVPLPRLESS